MAPAWRKVLAGPGLKTQARDSAPIPTRLQLEAPNSRPSARALVPAVELGAVALRPRNARRTRPVDLVAPLVLGAEPRAPRPRARATQRRLADRAGRALMA